MATTLTGIQDIDIGIINQLNDQELASFCQVDKYASNLCRGDRLWIERFQQYYPDIIPNKPEDMSWQDYYYLYPHLLLYAYGSDRKIFNLSKAVEDGFPPVIRAILDNYPEETEETIQKIIENNDLSLFRWLIDIYGYQPTFNDADTAVAIGDVDILDLLAERGIYPSDEGISLTVIIGEISSLEWLKQNNVIHQGNIQEYADEAMGYFIPASILWFMGENIYPSREAIREGIIKLTYKGDEYYYKARKDIIDTLVNKNLIDTQLIDELYDEVIDTSLLIWLDLIPSQGYIDYLTTTNPRLARDITGWVSRSTR